MRRSIRALTLIEVLAAMALLGMLAAALSSWLQVAGAFASSAAARLPWETAAARTLQRLQDDLLIGDYKADMPKDDPPRCSVIEGRLTIRTRDPRHGPVLREYRFNTSLEGLDQVTRPAQSPNEHANTRSLLGDVAEWSCAFDVTTRRLTVKVSSTAGQTIRRSFACPP